MIVLDVALVVLLVAATLIGLRRGLFASLGSFVGLVVGGAAAYWVMPIVNDLVPESAWRGLAVVGTGVLLLVLGAAVGGGIGRAVRRGADRMKLRVPERLLGGAVNLVAAALALSFVSSALVATGVPVVSAALSNSTVLRTIDEITPDPVRGALAQLRGTVLDEGIPQLGVLLESVPVEQAPEIALDDPALAEAAQSVAKITGVAYACGITATGSGFVAGEGMIVTNAHVVAGVTTPVVELPGQQAREGSVVYFDPIDDLAVIAVADMDATPLDIVPTLARGDAAVVQGYPYGGPFTSGAAQVRSVGTVAVPDVYGESSAPREIYALEATVRPGNSGGPLLTTGGEVAGVVFARAENDEALGYAMTMTELMPVLAQLDALDAAVATGECTA